MFRRNKIRCHGYGLQTKWMIQHKNIQTKLERSANIDTMDVNLDCISNMNNNDNELTMKQYIKQYKVLSKWNLSVLNGFVAASTAFMCSGGLLSVTIPSFIGCIGLATSASALNQIQEYKFDNNMLRTRLKRPLCTGKLTQNEALGFVLSTGLFGTFILYNYCGVVTALIGGSTMLIYNFIYTPLKRKTPYNTEFGAIVGALVPQIGIAASYHNILNSSDNMDVLWNVINDPLSWYLFVLLYSWQMPHFLYINIRNKIDYMRGGFIMWSNDKYNINDDNNMLSKRKSLKYSLTLLPLPVLLSYYNCTSYMFAFDGSLITAAYIFSVFKWYNEGNNGKYAKKSFYINLIYLPLFLTLMIIHSKRWTYKKGEFISTHLAYLQDKGIQYCSHVNIDDYEPSNLPNYIDNCTSPFRNTIINEKPSNILNINNEINNE